jgi:hypothetical protein
MQETLGKLKAMRLDANLDVPSVHSRLLEDSIPMCTPTQAAGTPQSVFSRTVNAISGAGYPIEATATATDTGTVKWGAHLFNNATVRVDGNFAYINGSIGYSDPGTAPEFEAGRWVPLFGLDTSSAAPAVARLLKPSSAIVGPVVENTGVAASGLNGGLVPHSAWNCGYGVYQAHTTTQFTEDTTAPCAMALLRIRCTAANTYSIDMLPTSTVTSGLGTASTVFLIFNGSWPIEKVVDNLAADLIA